MIEIVIAFVASLFAQFLKGYVAKKWGAFGIYGVTFMVAFLGTVVYRYLYPIPEWEFIITQSIETLAFAIAIYELILKRVGFADSKTAIKNLEN